jgi:hypothetical protein
VGDESVRDRNIIVPTRARTMLGRSLSLDKTLGVLESLTGAFLRLTVADDTFHGLLRRSKNAT